MSPTLEVDAGDYVLFGEAVKLTVVGPTRVEISDWKGRSRGRRNEDGTFTLEVSQQPLRGRSAEQYVVADLISAMQTLTKEHVAFRGGIDANGEDGVIVVGGGELDLQIVTVPANEHWGQVCAKADGSSATLSFSAEEGGEWIRDAIQKKSNAYAPSVKQRMMLALDARHAGILGHPEIVNAFLRLTPKWSGDGFAQVWLVGPGAYSERLWPQARSDVVLAQGGEK